MIGKRGPFLVKINIRIIERSFYLNKKVYIPLIIILLGLVGAFSIYYANENSPQEEPTSVNSSNDEWSEEMEQVEIPSTMDDKLQPAYFKSSEESAPLIVSLHQWSATYENFDPISSMIIEEDWNYIRPNFRGPNNNPQAGGSEYVINDIDDAIAYAIENGNVDEDRMYIVGTSGGGHAALMHLMTSEVNVSGYSVWVPITDLIAWYGESRLRDTKYPEEILQITDSESDQLNVLEARRRSPMYQETPVEKFEDTQVQIFAGINDGYDGTVPIGHSINFYNKLINDLDYGEENLIPYEIETQLLYTQTLYELDEYDFEMLGNRSIIYQTQAENISLTIFDGHHEILYEQAFQLLESEQE